MTKTKNKTLRTAIGMAIIVLLVIQANAAILVTNGSFELPVVGAPGYDVVTPDSWTAIDPGGNRRILNKNYGAVAGLIPSNVTGDQVAIIGSEISGPGVTDLFQGIGSTNSIINLTLTIDASNRGDGFYANGFTLGIWADTNADLTPDTALATLHVADTSLSSTAFQPFSVQAFSVAANTDLYIRFVADHNLSGGQTLLDNTQIAIVPVPEPGTTALLLGTGAAFWILRRRPKWKAGSRD